MVDIILNTPIGLDALAFETSELIKNNIDVDKIAKSLGEAWVFQNDVNRIQAIYKMYKLNILSNKWLILMKHRSNMKKLAQVLLYPSSVKLNLKAYLNIGTINVLYGKCKIISAKSFSYKFIPKICPLALKGSRLMRKFLAFKPLFIPMLVVVICSLSSLFFNNISTKIINYPDSLSIFLTRALNMIIAYHQYILYKSLE
jgi:hypothetical protein